MHFNLNLTFFLALALAAIVLLAIGSTLWQYGRAQEMLDEWAMRNQYSIQQREHRHLFKGPFFWSASRGQFVYRIVVQDQNGRQRVGWARVGSWFFGVWKNQVNVIWEDESRV